VNKILNISISELKDFRQRPLRQKNYGFTRNNKIGIGKGKAKQQASKERKKPSQL